MKKLNYLKRKLSKERLNTMQASQLKGGDDKRKKGDIPPSDDLPGGGSTGLPNGVAGNFLSAIGVDRD